LSIKKLKTFFIRRLGICAHDTVTVSSEAKYHMIISISCVIGFYSASTIDRVATSRVGDPEPGHSTERVWNTYSQNPAA
jgi:hypothetical protein